MPKINRNDGLGDDDPLPPLDKCDACFVLWRSLEGVLEAEPRMDKDRTDVLAGGRLDSRGAQTGTKHSYATYAAVSTFTLHAIERARLILRPHRSTTSSSGTATILPTI